MPKPTQRDIAETVSELRSVSRDLRSAAEGTPVEGMNGVVLISAKGLVQHANYLDVVADELMQLIPQRKVEIKP